MMQSTELVILTILFFTTALVYSSVGFGGGSTYLALLALFNFSYAQMPKVALICNLIVVTGGTIQYIRERKLCLRQVFPFVILSVPAAYLGGSIVIRREMFLFILAVSLLVAGLRLIYTGHKSHVQNQMPLKKTFLIGLPTGAIIGFISGLVGIGGGVFLSPLLYFLRWGSAQQIAASASFFILVNSLFGLLGQLSKGLSFPAMEILLPFVVAVLLGGQLGTLVSIKKFSPKSLQRLTAVLVLFVSIKILWSYL